MNLIKKTFNDIKNKLYNLDKKKKQDKILGIIETLIDEIKVEGDNILIKTNKNIVLSNDGNMAIVNSGVSVNISKVIHLNPKIDKNVYDNFNDLEENLKIAERKALKNMKNKMEKHNHN